MSNKSFVTFLLVLGTVWLTLVWGVFGLLATASPGMTSSISKFEEPR